MDFKNAPEEVVKAYTAKLKAEAKEHAATARREVALARDAEACATAQEMELIKSQRRFDAYNATDYETRFYRFYQDTSAKATQHCLAQVAEWVRMDKAEGVPTHVKIQFNSPGGSVFDGMALFDELQHWRRNGVKITTSTIGMAASMAGILLQAGDVRVMAPESWLLIHQASFGAIGSTYEIEDKVEHIRKIQDRILNIFSARAEGSNAEKPISKAQLKKRWERRDWWLASDEALSLGLIDEVR